LTSVLRERLRAAVARRHGRLEATLSSAVTRSA
jgi:hypothetical protein